MNGKHEIVKLLLEKSETNSININALNQNGNSGFHFACLRGHCKIVESLLKVSKSKPINISVRNYEGNSGLHLACANGQFETVKFLIDESEFDIFAKNARGGDALYEAQSKGHDKIVVFLKQRIRNLKQTRAS